MNINKFEQEFKHLINVPVFKYNSKAYNKKYGNVSVHEKEFNPLNFYYIEIDNEIYHISYHKEVMLSNTVIKNGIAKKYGLIAGNYLIKITENYLLDNKFIDYTPVAKYQKKLLEKYISLEKEINTLEKSNIDNFKEITNNIAELLEYKNKKYGNSALEPLNIFSGKCKVGNRIDDKLSRIKNSDLLRKNDIADVIGYLILLCKENNWTSFNEFMD